MSGQSRAVVRLLSCSVTALGVAVGASVSASSSDSVLDGVFTSSQASRGEQTFGEVCAGCHETSEFTGGRFRLSWVDRTAGDLFETISTLMPEVDPGSLSPNEYASLVAYLLELNGYPPGELDLPTDVAALKKIEIVDPRGP